MIEHIIIAMILLGMALFAAGAVWLNNERRDR